ncbi:MAG: hypothetical protein ABIZ05_07000 [Pseudonocardiaceae bacterium]
MIPRSSYVELFRASRAILDLLRRTALQIAPTTAGRLEAYGVSDEDYPLFLEDELLEERYASCMARPDIIIGPGGPKFLEFNVSGAAVGPVELHSLLRAWDFLYRRRDAPPFRIDDPFAARCNLFGDVSAELDVPARLLWVGSVRDLKHTTNTRYFDMELEYLHRHGFVADHAEPEQLDELLGTGAVARYRLGLRHFTIPEWRELGIDTTPVHDALKRGCLLLSTQTAAFLTNKKTLGLVSEGQPWMSRAERELAHTYIPWTRVLADRDTTRDGRRIDLLAHTLRHQHDLVLKRGIGMQGLQVTLGRDATSEHWHQEVQLAAARCDSIVQEYVEPGRCHVELSFSDHDPTPQITEVAPVLSPFLFGNYCGGVWGRFFATGASGIVSREGYGALENAVVAEL